MNDYRLTFSPELAAQIGLNEAIILQQVHYWVEHYKEKNDEEHFHDGRWWIYNTAEDWQRGNFPFWSESTIRRTFNALCEMGLIVKGRYNSHPYDRTLWYSIDEDGVAQLAERMSSRRHVQPAQDDEEEPVKVDDRSVQDGDVEAASLSTPIPDTTIDYTKTSADITPALPRESSRAEFERLFGPQPDYEEPETLHWSEKPWMKCAQWMKPRYGISAEALQRVYWLVEQHTGLEPVDSERGTWAKALAECFQAAKGDFGVIVRGIKAVWVRDPTYRPGHPRGFVDEIRKARVIEPEIDEHELFRQRADADPQVQTFRELRRKREQQAA